MLASKSERQPVTTGLQHRKMGPKAKAQEEQPTFKCSYCPRTFKRKSNRDSHELEHGSEPSFACSHPGCPLKYHTARALKIHEQKHVEESQKNLKCPCCPQGFTRKDALEKHVQKFHQAGWELGDAIIAKELTADEEGTYTCPECKQTFSSKKGLQVHMTRMHPEEKEEPREQPTAENTDAEANKEESEEPIECPLCKGMFNGVQGLKTHIGGYHRTTLNRAIAFTGAQIPSFTTTRAAQFHPSTEPTITQNPPSGLLAEAASTEQCDRCWKLGLPCLRFNDAPCHECTSNRLVCSPKRVSSSASMREESTNLNKKDEMIDAELRVSGEARGAATNGPSSASMHEISTNLDRQDEMMNAELVVSGEVRGVARNGQGGGWKDSKLKRKFEEVTDGQDELSSFPRYRHKEYQHLPTGPQPALTLRWTDEEWISFKESLDPLSPGLRQFKNILPPGFFLETHPEPNAINPQLAQTLRCLLKVYDSQPVNAKLSKPLVNQIYAAAAFLHDDSKRCMICGKSFKSGVMLSFHQISHAFNNIGIPGPSWAGTCWESVATAQIFYRTFCASVPAFLSPSSTSLRMNDVYITTDTDNLPGAGKVWFPCDNTALATSTSARLDEEAQRPAPPHVIVIARKSPDGMSATATDMARHCEYLLGFASQMCRAFGWSEIPVSAYTAYSLRMSKCKSTHCDSSILI